MKFTRKFVLVPHERFDEMQKKLVEKNLPLTKPFNAKDTLLQQGTGEVNEKPLTQWSSNKLNDSTLSGPAVNKEPPTDTPSVRNNETLDTEHIVGTLGKPYRHKARELLKLIQRTDPSIFTWTHSGEIVYNGQKINGSNIIDLIRSVMYKTKVNKPPGHLEFKHYLRQRNVPLTLVSNLESRDVINYKTQSKDVNMRNMFKVKGRKLKGNRVNKRKMWITL